MIVPARQRKPVLELMCVKQQVGKGSQAPEPLDTVLAGRLKCSRHRLRFLAEPYGHGSMPGWPHPAPSKPLHASRILLLLLLLPLLLRLPNAAGAATVAAAAASPCLTRRLRAVLGSSMRRMSCSRSARMACAGRQEGRHPGREGHRHGCGRRHYRANWRERGQRMPWRAMTAGAGAAAGCRSGDVPAKNPLPNDQCANHTAACSHVAPMHVASLE